MQTEFRFLFRTSLRGHRERIFQTKYLAAMKQKRSLRTKLGLIKAKLGFKNHEIRVDRDIWLASYPRTGNTWIRGLISSAIQGEPIKSLTELDYFVPDRYIACPARKLAVDRSGPIIMKTHEPSFLESPAHKVIYIIRDPLAVAWSYYNFHRRRKVGNPKEFDEFLMMMLNGQVWPGCWASHARSWILPNEDNVNREILVVRYEDLRVLNPATLKGILDFIGLDFRCSDPSELFKWTSIDRMQSAEKAGNPDMESGWFIGGSGSPEFDPDSRSAAALKGFRERNKDITEAWGYL